MLKKTIKVKTLITEDEKNTNPIFKAIYKKIRNLTKKISSIQSLEKENRDNLKPDQLLKIQKKQEICQQVAKCQQFALFYKELLQDKEVSNNIIMDQLIKIATALAVCQAVKQEGGTKDKTLQQVMTKFIQPITAEQNSNMNVGDRIVETVGLLSEFLKHDKYYTSCRNYISDFARSSAIQSSKQSEKGSSYQNKNNVKNQFEETQQDNIKHQTKLQKVKENKKNEQKQLHASQEKQKKEKSSYAEKSHAQQKDNKQNINQKEFQIIQNEIQKTQTKLEGKENQIQKQIEVNKESTKQNQISQGNQDENKTKVHYQRNYQNKNYRQNRDYNNNQYRNNNRTQQYQGKPRTWNRDKQYEERPRNYKPRQTVRQGSDTSLEPTPQKVKKPKYVEKI